MCGWSSQHQIFILCLDCDGDAVGQDVVLSQQSQELSREGQRSSLRSSSSQACQERRMRGLENQGVAQEEMEFSCRSGRCKTPRPSVGTGRKSNLMCSTAGCIIKSYRCITCSPRVLPAHQAAKSKVLAVLP